jgi:hypothetical protein
MRGADSIVVVRPRRCYTEVPLLEVGEQSVRLTAPTAATGTPSGKPDAVTDRGAT